MPAPPARPAQDGVDEARRARCAPLGQLDALVDRRVLGGTAENSSSNRPEPQHGEHRRVEPLERAPVSCAATWSSVARRWTVPYASAIASARSRGSSPAASAVKRAIGVGALLEHAADDASAHARAGDTRPGLRRGVHA